MSNEMPSYIKQMYLHGLTDSFGSFYVSLKEYRDWINSEDWQEEERRSFYTDDEYLKIKLILNKYWVGNE